MFSARLVPGNITETTSKILRTLNRNEILRVAVDKRCREFWLLSFEEWCALRNRGVIRQTKIIINNHVIITIMAHLPVAHGLSLVWRSYIN